MIDVNELKITTYFDLEGLQLQGIEPKNGEEADFVLGGVEETKGITDNENVIVSSRQKT